VESCRRPKDWIQHVALLLRNGRTRRSRYKKAGFCTAATAEDPVAKWGGFSGAIETNRQSSQSQLLVIPSKAADDWLRNPYRARQKGQTSLASLQALAKPHLNVQTCKSCII
jgi:hypothetical protein